tara:strand:+ start:63 stop:332 length:270 start_codon:yes stop_codon:yes gene_type:complete
MIPGGIADKLGNRYEAKWLVRFLMDVMEKGDQHGRRATHLHQLQDLLKRKDASSESKPPARKKILDLVDLMLFREIYGVDSIVTTHDRW